MHGFKITQMPKKRNKNLPKPPSGREWTEEEKKVYYENLSKNWTDWRDKAIKLITKTCIELNQHRDTATNLRDIEDFLHKCYSNGMTPNEGVDSYKNKH